jgi:predicted metal-dependent hydrolase
MAINILPTRRNLHFKLDASKALDWHQDGRNVSLFLNTLSLFFPVGERFFIDSVRHYRDRIQDPELKKAVAAFIGQEAMHGREHDEYNHHVAEAGVPIEAQERFVGALLKRLQQTTPAAFQLANTVALEHLTAILADGLLSLPELMEDSDAGYRALWNWHALEETEHKAVAFDVYQRVVGEDTRLGAYALRSASLVLATSVFFALFLPFYVNNVRVSGGLFDGKGWRAVLRHSLGKRGIFRYSAGAWLDWFKPGFHPWDHDNREFLDQFDTLVAHALKDAA